MFFIDSTYYFSSKLEKMPNDRENRSIVEGDDLLEYFYMLNNKE
jgi:hypothetical protein